LNELFISRYLGGLSFGEALPHHQIDEHNHRTFGHSIDSNAAEYRASFHFDPLNEEQASRIEAHMIDYFERANIAVVHRTTISRYNPDNLETDYDPPVSTTIVFAFPLSNAKSVQESIKKIGETSLLPSERQEIQKHLVRHMQAHQRKAMLAALNN